MTLAVQDRALVSGGIPAPERVVSRVPWAGLVLLALAAVPLRLPYLRLPLSPDEAGFSQVAAQWGHGSSLYGDYWVDRPPLLLGLFRLAGVVPGPVSLRLVGTLAVMVSVVAVGGCAGLLARSRTDPGATRRTSWWAGGIALAALVSPVTGAPPVNGELLAAPFIALSLLAWIWSMRATSGRAAAACSGAAAVAAVMIKQNMLDGLVFVAVVAIVLVLRDGSSRRPIAHRLVAWGLGAGGAAAAVLGLAAMRGTSPGGVWFAMYPFRLRAADAVMVQSVGQRATELGALGVLELLTGGPLLLGLLAYAVLRHRRTMDPVALAGSLGLLAVAAYDLVSIAAGGSYWAHYLVQLVTPAALAGGLVAGGLAAGGSVAGGAVRSRGRLLRAGRSVAVGAVVVAMSVWGVSLAVGHRTSGSVVGAAVRSVARPGDGIVSALGSPDIVAYSGLRSDYRYLWSLPARTLDPRFGRLAAVLDGDRPPVWLVLRGSATRSTLMSSEAGPAIRHDYEPVATVCGRTVYRLRTADRAVPPQPAACGSPPLLIDGVALAG